MRAIDRKEIEKIYKIMGMLDRESLEKSKKYIIKSISVFDHWLLEEGYCGDDKAFFYQEALETTNTSAAKQYFAHHDNLLKFYLDLYNKTKIYGILSAEYGPSNVIVEYDNIKEYEAHVLLSIREQLLLKIYIPEFFTIIRGNYDLTHLLYILKSKIKIAEVFYAIARSNSLFILD